MVSRIGTFFLLIGGLLLILFLFSDYARSPLYNLFCLAAPLLLIGYFFKQKGKTPPPPNERFNMMRKYRQREKEKALEKEGKK